MFVPTQHWTKTEKLYPNRIQSDSSMSQGQFPRTTVLNSQKVIQIKMTFSFAHFYNEAAITPLRCLSPTTVQATDEMHSRYKCDRWMYMWCDLSVHIFHNALSVLLRKGLLFYGGKDFDYQTYCRTI